MDRRDQTRLTLPIRRALAGMGFAAFFLTGCGTLTGALLTPDIDPAATKLASGDFVLDTDHAALIFRINHLGYADYVGRFERFEANLSGDPSAPSEARVDAVIDIASLDVANPDFASTLTGPGWFDAAAYPQARFGSTEIELTGAATARIEGKLTLKGVTRPVVLNAKLNGSAYDPLRRADVIGFSASGEIDRAEFGIDRFSGLVTDTVRIEIEAEFIRKAPD